MDLNSTQVAINKLVNQVRYIVLFETNGLKASYITQFLVFTHLGQVTGELIIKLQYFMLTFVCWLPQM